MKPKDYETSSFFSSLILLFEIPIHTLIKRLSDYLCFKGKSQFQWKLLELFETLMRFLLVLTFDRNVFDDVSRIISSAEINSSAGAYDWLRGVGTFFGNLKNYIKIRIVQKLSLFGSSVSLVALDENGR